MKKTKLLTSVAALALVLGLGACNETTEEEAPGTGDEYIEPESITDYTVSFSFTTDGSATTLPSYATAYIIGDWDGWKEFLPLVQTGAAAYSYTFSEISTGTHEYKGVMQYTYKEVSWEDGAEIITDDEGGNATFTVSGLDEGSQSITEELRVTSLATYENADDLLSGAAKAKNYKATYADITYVSTVGTTYGEYQEDESVLHSEEVLASRELSYYSYYEGYFTEDVVVVKVTMDYGYGASYQYYVYLNASDTDYFYMICDYGYGSGWTGYYGSPFQGGWNDSYNSLFWVKTYSDIYFKPDHTELIDSKYAEVYTQSETSSSLYFQVFGVDTMMQSQYSASYLATYFSHEYSYFFPEDERLISDYHNYSLSWDWQDGYNSDYSGPASEEATVYLQDEEALLIVDEIGSIDEEEILAYANQAYDAIYGGAAG